MFANNDSTWSSEGDIGGLFTVRGKVVVIGQKVADRNDWWPRKRGVLGKLSWPKVGI